MESLMAHNRLLTQRNILLKQMAASERPDLGLLDVYDQQIAHHGNIISAKRREFVEWLKPVVTNLYNQISDGHEDVGMAYATCLDRYDLYGGLVEARPRDLILGYTSRGVQKDDIEITMDGYQIKRVGSQGQRKSVVIALKLAQYHYLTERKATRPLLLLDDVFDKLDSSRGDRLIAMMASDDFGQTFITDTDMARLKDVLGKVGKRKPANKKGHAT